MFPRRRKHWIKPDNPVLNLSNPIAKKFDFYVPHNSGSIAGKDIVGKIDPTVTNTNIITSTLGKVRDFTYPAHLDYGDQHDIGAGNFSVGCWFRTTQNTSSSFITKAAANGDDFRWSLNIGGGGNLQLFIADTSTYFCGSAATQWDDDKWHFVVAVIDRIDQNLYLYVDGSRVATTVYTGTSTFNTSHVLIIGEFGNSTGSAPNDNFQQFLGELSDCFICHSALSKHEIKSLYDDFYQVLEKRTQLLPLTIPAVSGFKPAWAMASSRANLIGAR